MISPRSTAPSIGSCRRFSLVVGTCGGRPLTPARLDRVERAQRRGDLGSVAAIARSGSYTRPSSSGSGCTWTSVWLGSRRLEERVPARRHLAEPTADREHEVGVAQPAGDAPRPSRRRARRRSSASGCRRSPGSGTRTRRGARSPRRTPARRGSSRPSSRPRRRRRAGALRRRAARAARSRSSARGAIGSGSTRARVGDVGLLGEHVLGQREHDRPRPPGERDRERLAPCARGSARRCRPPTPPSRCRRTPARSRAPATPRGRETRAAPGRRGGSSARSPASPCARRPLPASRRARA